MNGPRMNADYRKVAAQVEAARATDKVESAIINDGKKRDVNDLSGFPIEHARLRSLRECLQLCSSGSALTRVGHAAVFFGLLIASTITYGWVLDKGVHFSVPLIMQFIGELLLLPADRDLSADPLAQSASPSRASSIRSAHYSLTCTRVSRLQRRPPTTSTAASAEPLERR
jgi:hypothetical protein